MPKRGLNAFPTQTATAAVTLSNGNEALDERASYFKSFKLNECVSAPSLLLVAAIICGLLFAGIAVFISTPPPPDFFVVAPAAAPELKGTALQQREERLVITQARERASQAS